MCDKSDLHQLISTQNTNLVLNRITLFLQFMWSCLRSSAPGYKAVQSAPQHGLPREGLRLRSLSFCGRHRGARSCADGLRVSQAHIWNPKCVVSLINHVQRIACCSTDSSGNISLRPYTPPHLTFHHLTLSASSVLSQLQRDEMV